MASNKFQVYGQVPAGSNVFPTDSTSTSDYSKLFSKGIKPDTVAKSQDVLTPLRELTIFSVAFFNWLIEQGLTGDANIEFKDAVVVDGNESQTRTNLTNMLSSVKLALEQAITNKINAKEPIIDRNNSTKKGFLKYSGSVWEWDQTTYQAVNAVLTQIQTFLNTSANEGMLYKSSGSATLKATNKQFVYFDSESTDSSGNKILNLKTISYSS